MNIFVGLNLQINERDMNVLQQPSTLVGIFWMLLHCLNLAIMSIMVRLCTNEGFQIFELFFLSSLFSFLCMLIWAFFVRERQLKIKAPRMYVLRVMFSVLSLVTWFYVLKLIPITEATAISYLAPLFTGIAAVLFLGERFNSKRCLALVMSFFGILLILRPGIEIVALGSILAIVSAVFSSASEIFTKIQTRIERLATQTFYETLWMTLLSLPFAMFVWKTPTITQIMMIGLLGLTFLVNFFAIFLAYRNADLTIILPLDFTRLIFTLILAYWLFRERLDVWTGIGAIIILSSAVYMARQATQTNITPLMKQRP